MQKNVKYMKVWLNLRVLFTKPWNKQICGKKRIVSRNTLRQISLIIQAQYEAATLTNYTVSLSNKNADIPDIINSNQKLDVLLDGTLLSHAMNLKVFVLTPNIRICRVSTEREKISTSGCHFWHPGRWCSCCFSREKRKSVLQPDIWASCNYM